MSANHQALTEKEKQTLRLIVRGHDAKSIARHLDLSVHTVNERLRDARRKLQVSSSREAARQLFESEGNTPQNQTDKQLGEAAPAAIADKDATDHRHTRSRRLAGAIAGVLIMLTAIVALSLVAADAPPSSATKTPSAATQTQQAIAETDVVRAARDWLVLGDQGRWNDGWLATATTFRRANTAERWADAATRVRVPMGALISRTALSQDSVPAPPDGVEVVKFRTSFANKADVVETVSLVREGSAWKVVGIYVD